MPKTRCEWLGFKAHHVYRISKSCDSADLAGRTVTFVRARPQSSYDVERAIVRVLNADGSAGVEWLVMPQFVLPI